MVGCVAIPGYPEHPVHIRLHCGNEVKVVAKNVGLW